jgi:cell division protein FtsQ
MKSFLKFLLPAVVVGSAMLGLGFYLDRTGFFNLTRVDLLIEQSDNQVLKMRDKISSLQNKLETHRGQALYKIELDRIKLLLSDEVWISSYQISRRWPSKIEVLIKPEKIYFSILSSTGELRPVIQTGEMLEAVKINASADVPIIRQSEFLTDEELRKRAIQLLKDVPMSGVFSRAEISEIQYSEKEGFTLFMSRDHLRVKLGEKQVRNKSLQVVQVMQYLENKKIQARVIDANLSEKVLVRLRKAP